MCLIIIPCCFTHNSAKIRVVYQPSFLSIRQCGKPLSHARIERFELLRDLIEIRNTLVFWNPPSSRTQRRMSNKSGVFKHFPFKPPTAPLSNHRARMAYATICAEHVSTASHEFVTCRTADRVSAQHIERRFARTFHLTHFTHGITGHTQRLELLGTLDFLPCLNSAALLLPQCFPTFRRGCGDFRVGNQRTRGHLTVKFRDMDVGDNLIRLIISRPQGLLLFSKLLSDTSCDLLKLLGTEVSQKRFGDSLGEASGTVIPDRPLSAYLRRPDCGVAF